MAVTFQAAGTAAAATTGTLTVPWPTHQANDVALLFVTSSAGGTTDTLTTANGFTLINTQTTGSGTAGTRLSTFWARATSSSMASPVLTAGSDFKYGVILTFRGARTVGSPIDGTVQVRTKGTASTTATFGSVTTTLPNALIVHAISSDLDSASGFVTSLTNTGLTDITERFDAGTTNGLGGGIGVVTGTKVAAGLMATSTATVTSSINTMQTIALVEPSGTVNFTVTDASTGASVSGASVFIADPATGATRKSGTTDVSGLAALEWVTGTYKLVTVATGYVTQYWNNKFGLAAGDQITLTESGFSAPMALMPGAVKTGTINGTASSSGVAEIVEPALVITGSATATFDLAASGDAVKRVTADRTATLKLAATGAASSTRTGAATATLKLTATRTGAGTHNGTSTGTVKLTATRTGAKVAAGTRTAPFTLTTSGTAAPTRTGANTATIRLTAQGIAGDKVGAASAPIRLGASVTSSSVRTGTATATLKLTATRAGTSVRTGTRTGTIRLTSTFTGTRTHTTTGTAALHLTATWTGDTIRTSTRTAAAWFTATSTATSLRDTSSTAVLILTASGVGALPQRNITLIGRLLPRRWDSELTDRNKAGALHERDVHATLTTRDATGTLQPRRWEGHTQ